MSSEQLRHAYADPSARQDAGFVACAWTGWIWGLVPWLGVVYYAFPTVWAVYHGKLTPLPPSLWVARGLFFVFAFLFLPAFALYAGWAFFAVVRVGADKITVGRWFGARQSVYRSSDITTWRLVDRRLREVSDAKSASRLRIDFADGSWVRMSRYAWNFRSLEAWLRRRAASAGGPAARGSSAPRSTQRFVVRDVLMMFAVLGMWVCCWMIVAYDLATTFSRRLHPPSGLGDVALHLLWFVMAFLLPFIFGPLAAHGLLKEVRVDAPHIHVDRWFGLSRRTYREDDIKTWRVSLDPNPPWWRHARESSLVLRFADGASVFVMEHATNFHALYDYLRDRALTREDVRRSAKSGV